MKVFLKNTASVVSPAKLNLFLDVVDKRPDGYHNIVTLFERIDLCDVIRLIKISSDEIVVSSNSQDIPLDRQNLAYQAADLLKRSLGIKTGIKIEIEKNIPVGAGLGGGSSNAASVLLGLNKLLRLKLDQRTLISYANRLGSDVAFFVLGKKFALGRGKGGDLKALAVPKRVKLRHLLFVPPLKIMTKDVYGLLDKEENRQKSLKLTKKSPDVNILVSLLRRNDVSLLNQNIHNRLSKTVMNSYSLVSDLKTDLCKFGLKNVHMSGSGPTLFSTFKTHDEAQRLFEVMRHRFSDRCSIFLVSTL